MGKTVQVRAMKDDEVEMILEEKADDFKPVPLQDQTTDRPEEAKDLVHFLTQRDVRYNLVIMTLIWLSIALSYYLLMSLDSTSQQDYQSALFFGTSEVVACVMAGIAFHCVGTRVSLIFSFVISFVGGISILAVSLNHEDASIPPFLLMTARFGIASALTIVYVAHSTLFPVGCAATALGICNFLAKGFTASTPVMPQMEGPLPLVLFIVTTAAAAILALGIETEDSERTNRKYNKAKEKLSLDEDIKQLATL